GTAQALEIGTGFLYRLHGALMPNNFCFVIEGVLAGMERPGTHASLREDLAFLKKSGVGAIVSLTESALDPVPIREFGFRYLHLPVADFTPPTLEQIMGFIEFQQRAETDRIP